MTYQIKLEKQVFGGDCMAHLPDGRAVFIPFGIPGETVEIALTEEKKRFARGRILEVLESSDKRIQPKCQHFTECGGCQYQHLEYSQQLQVKQALISNQLERIAGLKDFPVKPITSSQPWHYRNRVQFHVREDGKLSFLKTGSHEPLDLKECHLLPPAIEAIWQQISFDSLEDIDRIELVVGSDNQVMMVLQGEQEEIPRVEIELPISTVHLGPKGTTLMSGHEYVLMQILDRTFSVSAGSFFQVNNEMAEKMVAQILDLVDWQADMTIMDMYCGVGLFSAFLAPRVKHCISLEYSPLACLDFAVNLDEFENVSLYEGAAEDILPGFNETIDVLLVDPPRSGIAGEALDAICRLKPPILIYISCDSATFARDLKRLGNSGYQLDQITPYDLFPQTGHIETISLIRLNE